MTVTNDAPKIPLYLHVSHPPYENYFYADNTVSCQAVLANPVPRTDAGSPTLHRLLFAWPAGNSGAAAFFRSSDSKNDALSIHFKDEANQNVLDPVSFEDPSQVGPSSLGVSGLISFSNSAVLSLAILGSVRSIRDYTEGNGVLNPKVQRGVQVHELDNTENGVRISRLWFDGKTMTQLTFAPATSTSYESGKAFITQGDASSLATFAPGVYAVQAHLNHPQPGFIPPSQLLKPTSHHLIQRHPDPIKSLSFLCTPGNLLAGAWRFLTYFGRDSMISLLILNPVLSEGEKGVIEAGLRAVLERINYEDGSVCHEENIGDYPAAQAALNGADDPNAQYDYKMVLFTFFSFLKCL